MSNGTEAPAVPREEAMALIRFVTDRGLDKEAKITVPLKQALDQRDAATDDPARQQADDAVIREYGKLTGITYDRFSVNGRSVLQSEKAAWRSWAIISYSLGFFFFAMGTEMLDLYFGDTPVPDAGFYHGLSNVHSHVLTLLSPFFWGGLGACVYLLKKLSDFASEQKFDPVLLKGYQTRIWLGALLGAVVQYIFFDAENITSTKVMFGANAVAFLSGVGVKVVYGAIEKTVASLGEAMNLDALKRPPPKQGNRSEAGGKVPTGEEDKE